MGAGRWGDSSPCEGSGRQPAAQFQRSQGGQGSDLAERTAHLFTLLRKGLPEVTVLEVTVLGPGGRRTVLSPGPPPRGGLLCWASGRSEVEE